MDARTPTWTEDDLKGMALSIAKEFGESGFPSYTFGELPRISRMTERPNAAYGYSELWDILHCPKDDALLYINTGYVWVLGVAAWRLEHGR